MVLIGAGGHAKVIIDIILRQGQLEIVGLTDPRPELAGRKIMGVPVLGGDDVLPEVYRRGVKNALIAVGSTRANSLRQKLFEKVRVLGFVMACAVHPRSTIAADIRMGEGVAVMAGAVVNPGTVMGNNVVINTGSVVEHDCVLEDHVHIAPCAVIGGGARVMENSHVGLGAVVLPGVAIGAGATIGAGAVVINNVPAGATVAGVPAKVRDELRG